MKNPTTDYQPVTSVENLPDFQNNFPFAEFHRKEI